MDLLVGIDQGTSGTTVLVLDSDLKVRGKATRLVTSRHTEDGGIEQDPWAVLASVTEACGEALTETVGEVKAVGFAHQGESVLAWDPNTLEPLTPVIVWSDRRPDVVTRDLVENGLAERIFELSGLRLDSYFCAAKYRWIIDQVPAAAARTKTADLRLGTLETWLLMQLGATETTDIGTASRTQLTQLGDSVWDADLLSIFGISPHWLVPIGPSITERGMLSHNTWSFSLPLKAVMVDQPAGLVGNGCLQPGDMKITYGTGAFVVVNAGRAKPRPQSAVIASVGWGDESGPVFTFDGGVLSAGSAISWLGGLGVDVGPEAHLRLSGRDSSKLTFVPAFNGMGAPHWKRDATASVSGISSNTTGDDLLHALLDSITYRVREIVDVMEDIGVPRPLQVRVDGGLCRSPYLMQHQADVLGIPLVIANIVEATAFGVAIAAAGIDRDVLSNQWTFIEPSEGSRADEAYERWRVVRACP